MFKMVKADLVRIFSGTGIYVVIGLIITLLVLLTAGIANADMNSGLFYEMGEEMSATRVILLLGYFLVLVLPLLIVYLSDEFKNGTVRNSLIYGFSRKQFYVSKIIVAWLLMTLIYSIYFIYISITFPLIFSIPWTITLMEVFIIVCLQLFVFYAMTAFGIFLIFLLRQPAFILGAFVLVFVVGPTHFTNYFGVEMPLLSVFSTYDFEALLTETGYFTQINGSLLWRNLPWAMGYFLLSTGAGIYLFNKSEIK